MNPDVFWTSQDGQILTVKNKDERTVTLTMGFWPRHPAEFEFLKAQLAQLKFTERSAMARIGIEMITSGPLRVEGNRVELDADAFIFDASFPNAGYWKKLMRVGAPVGRLFHAPVAAKLSTAEIWAALKENRIKLPNTISIDSVGRVFLTPHQLVYTLSQRLGRADFERIVSGVAGRGYIDRVQIRHEAAPLVIAPRSGILTSCSMYLKEHFVVLNPGAGNFGIHTSAVLLDPIKTFGTNIMLEIYNPGDQPVVNPMVSVEVFRAPEAEDPEFKTLAKKRNRLLLTAKGLYKCLDENPVAITAEARPKTQVSVRGQSGSVDNRAVIVRANEDLKRFLEGEACPVGSRTMIQALDAAPDNGDTLVLDYFPSLLEHIELLARMGSLKLKRIVFRKASRTHGYFLSSNDHSRIDTLAAIGVQVYWYDELTKDIYLHTYKKNHGFFVREESARRFQESTILAFYGSAWGLEQADTDRISHLVDKLTSFIGHNLGVLTGGGRGHAARHRPGPREGRAHRRLLPRTGSAAARARRGFLQHVPGIRAALPAKVVRGGGFLRLQRRRRRHPRGGRHRALQPQARDSAAHPLRVLQRHLLGRSPPPAAHHDPDAARAGVDDGLRAVHRRSRRGRRVLPEEAAGALAAP